MKLLVPLPFDVSHMAHGRNLRIVHLLRALTDRCHLQCVTPDDRLAEAARTVLPNVTIASARASSGENNIVSLPASRWVRRAVSFLGSDPRLVADLPAGGTRLLQAADGYVATAKRGQVIAEQGELTGARPGRLQRGRR